MKYFYYKILAKHDNDCVVQSRYPIHNRKQASRILKCKVEKIIPITANQYFMLRR